MTEEAPREPADRRADLAPLGTRLRSVATWLALGTLVAIVVDGMVRGLDFTRMGLWLSVFAVCLLVAAAVTVAIHALRGAGAAGRRGERLSSDDVGLLPRKRAD